MKKYTPSILFFLILLLIWQSAVTYFNIQTWILPSPLQILISLWHSRDLLLYHLLPTVWEALIGLCLSAISAICIAIAMKSNRIFAQVTYPLLILSQTIPFIVIAPLLTIWFGFGMLPKIILIALVCFFPIALNVYDGLQSVPKPFISLLDSMGATKSQKIKYLYWPSSLPHFFTGLKIAGAYCILSAVISEWVGSERGLGILLIRSSKSYVTDRVFATIVIITLLSVCLVFFITLLQNISMPWTNVQIKERPNI